MFVSQSKVQRMALVDWCVWPSIRRSCSDDGEAVHYDAMAEAEWAGYGEKTSFCNPRYPDRRQSLGMEVIS